MLLIPYDIINENRHYIYEVMDEELTKAFESINLISLIELKINDINMYINWIELHRVGSSLTKLGIYLGHMLWVIRCVYMS